jgi:hypothetical protein
MDMDPSNAQIPDKKRSSGGGQSLAVREGRGGGGGPLLPHITLTVTVTTGHLPSLPTIFLRYRPSSFTTSHLHHHHHQPPSPATFTTGHLYQR